jgi:hypothetical protein
MTAPLYRLNRAAPAGLPMLAYDGQGRAWTDLANQPPEVLLACGLVEAPPQPVFNAASEMVVWDVGQEAWRIEAKPVAGMTGPLAAAQGLG